MTFAITSEATPSIAVNVPDGDPSYGRRSTHDSTRIQIHHHSQVACRSTPVDEEEGSGDSSTFLGTTGVAAFTPHPCEDVIHQCVAGGGITTSALRPRVIPCFDKAPPMKRMLAWLISGIGAVGVVLLAISSWNYFRIDASALSTGMQEVINRSKRIRNGSGPDYQEAVLGSLPMNALTGPIYRLDDRLHEAIVVSESTSRTDPDAIDAVFSYEFDTRGALVAADGRSTLSVADGVLTVEHDGSDYLLNGAEMRIPKDDIGEISIRLRTRSGKHLRMAWSSNAKPENIWINRIDIPIVPDGQFHIYSVNAKNAMKGGVGRGLRTGDDLLHLYIKPSDVDGDRVEIDFIRFISKRSKYLRKPRGAAYETIGKEMRRVLYMLPNQELEYALRVPKSEPRLDFGIGVLLDGEPVTFEVVVRDGPTKIPIFKTTVHDTGRWQEARLDLGTWAGREVALRISVRGSRSNVAFWSNPSVSLRPAKPFRVVILLEDTLRSDYLSTYGYDQSTAPFKDRLMRDQGIVFLNAVSQATKTRPSVPSMMTSLLPSATGVWDFADMLGEQYVTLAEIMRQQGFSTASFVQNGNAGPLAGAHQGFGMLLDSESIGTTPEEILGDRLRSWIAKHRDRNFFLYVHVIDPHGIYEAPPPFDRWYRDTAPGESPQPLHPHLDPGWMEHATTEGRRNLYAGEIRHNDSVIEGFVAFLQELDLFDDTFLIFTSDHGEHLGERNQWEHDPPGFLQVTGVPLMFVYPNRFLGNQRITENVQVMDIMPTVLELAQVHTEDILMQGDSLVDLVEGRRMPEWRNRVTLSEEPSAMDKTRSSRNTGVRVFGSMFYRDWHFIASRRFWPRRGYWPESFRLKAFDVADDRQEERSLWSFVPDLYMRYKYTQLLNHVQANGIEAWSRWTNGGDQEYRFDPDVLDQLEALGYVQ